MIDVEYAWDQANQHTQRLIAALIRLAENEIRPDLPAHTERLTQLQDFCRVMRDTEQDDGRQNSSTFWDALVELGTAFATLTAVAAADPQDPS